jgi:hypothetical protein
MAGHGRSHALADTNGLPVRLAIDIHVASRWRCSGHCFRCRATLSGKTCTSQGTTCPSLYRFSYPKRPTGSLPTAPTTPASSNASLAAEWCGAFPFCGQPFGIIQRCVSRDVMSMTSVRALVDRYGKAAYCTRFAGGTRLERLIRLLNAEQLKSADNVTLVTLAREASSRARSGSHARTREARGPCSLRSGSCGR